MTTMKLMRIYTDETAYHGDRKVFEIVAERARDARLGGATVLQATIGFGWSAHTRLNADVPIHLYDTRAVPLEGRGIATISVRAHARTRVHTASRSALMTGDGCASAA